MENLPAGHECQSCGARLEGLVVDWTDADGQRVVFEDGATHCAECARRYVVDKPNDDVEVVVEDVDGGSSSGHVRVGDLGAVVAAATLIYRDEGQDSPT
jgi:hypothetical protein